MTETLQIPTARVYQPLLRPARYKAAYGGRGSGKSHFFAGYVVEEAYAGRGAPQGQGKRILCVREKQRSLKQSSKLLIEDKIQAFGLGKLFDCQNDKIVAPNGGVILFEGMQNHTAESIKSFEGFDIVWIEEARGVSQRSLDLLRPTIRKFGSEIWASWNPEQPNDPVEKLFRSEDTPPGSIVVQANYSDNPWFDDTTLPAEMEWDRKRDPDKFAHVWMGGYAARSEARVFKNWRIDELDIPKGARPYFGADWGFAIDPTVLLRMWVWDRTIYIDREARGISVEIDKTPALFARVNDDRVPNVGDWPIRGDNARPETISYLQRHGFPKLVPARKGPNSVNDGVEFLKSYDIVVHPDCRHTSDELSSYSYVIDKHTDEVLPELEDKKNHCIDAARYALEDLRNQPKIAMPMPYIAGVARGVIPH